ncbi:hypothetical protein [Trichocoleus sp. FACHB-262]|uniref:hypothetical protein n=1 Tax=Trichocoleus sp. FACHB-262 TaxID=2692869 RepID=UPI001688A900|nr:hypothetical protein [Trichocoleus sp. FACHB-262]MBD2119519.1 hypothetical protein [Trichocoleus sp. FACHB-262]
MTDSTSFDPWLEPKADSFDYNQLNELGNRAIALGLLIGHGYHGDQYELLHLGEVVLLSPPDAHNYLKALVQTGEQLDG